MGWTDERVELLKKLWQEGLSASQIAKALGGVTRNSVIGKVHRLGLSGRAPPRRSRTGLSIRAPRPAPLNGRRRVRSMVEPAEARGPAHVRGSPGDAAGLQPIPFEDAADPPLQMADRRPQVRRPTAIVAAARWAVRPDGRRRSYCDEHQAASQPDLALRPHRRQEAMDRLGRQASRAAGSAPQRPFSDSGRHLYSLS
jgi:hypothetical protein